MPNFAFARQIIGLASRNTARNVWYFVDIVTKYNEDLTQNHWDEEDERVTAGSWNWHFETKQDLTADVS